MEQTAESHSFANAVQCCGKLDYSTLSRKSRDSVSFLSANPLSKYMCFIQ